ncbi:MAG: AAA family ATPase, partial [Candidatus Dormibacteraeota bacterium]|nr:AAA family ATPase [Candidatus Dormibacteraeota bacterium]
MLRAHDYLASRHLATSILVALRIGKPLFLEGEAGVGKTEAARALAQALGARLIRLQCYEGIDLAHAAYEWNYARQLLHIRVLGEDEDRARLEKDLFGPE